MSKLRKRLTMLAAVLTLLGAMPAATALAETVYYKGSAVYWNYGRTWGVWGFSEVQSSSYEHVTSVNGATSGWQSPGVLAYAKKYVGIDTMQIYWNCRG